MSMSGPRAPRWCSQGGGPGAEERQFPPRICWSDAAVAIGTLGLHFMICAHQKHAGGADLAERPPGVRDRAQRPTARPTPFPLGVWRAPSVETCLRETDRPVAHASGG
jgi:hypothetical protein